MMIKNLYKLLRLREVLCLAGCLVLLTHCAGQRPYTLGKIKTLDPDMADIAPPKDLKENQIWDILDYTLIYQVEKPLDLNWLGRKVGKGLGLNERRQADNVNVLDEVPASSWYTPRHYHQPMSVEALKKGPNISGGPDHNGKWTIIRGKFEGGTPGFTIEDPKGNSYIVKFDALKYQEMGSSAEVISTKIFYAAGYFVPQNTIEFVHPDSLVIGEGVKFEDDGIKRQMTREDLDNMLANTPRRADGSIRVLTSKYVDGKPVGIWTYRGRRSDDPNDRVDHEHRRELRGLRSISSWLSDEDRRAANTLAVYATNKTTGNRFIKHYLIDMGSTLGSNNTKPHDNRYGNEYLVDLRSISLQFLSLGFWVKPWEFVTEHLDPTYPSVGYYDGEIFDPGDWYATYPNPAFEYCTPTDAFWGAKIVMAFSDEHIRAIVGEARMSNKSAEAYLTKTMITRRDKVGRYWFERMNPLDKFRFEGSPQQGWTLRFNDLAVDGNLARASSSNYAVNIYHGESDLLYQGDFKEPAFFLNGNDNALLFEFLKNNSFTAEEDRVFKLEIRTLRTDHNPSNIVNVYCYFPDDQNAPRVVGIKREE